MLKSVDYAASSISSLTFKEPERFRATVRNLAPGSKDFYLGDNYYVVRNGSMAGNGSIGNGSMGNWSMGNGLPVEEAYQFVGPQIAFLRNRVLNESRELAEFRGVWVDASFPTQLVVLNAFAVPGGLEIAQFVYGSLASVNKVVPPANPPYISFPVPPHTALFAPRDALAWAFLNADPTPLTNFTVRAADPAAPNNLRVLNGAIVGDAKVLAMSANCLLLIDSISRNVTLAAMPPSNGTNGSVPSNSSFTFENVTPLLANLSVGN